MQARAGFPYSKIFAEGWCHAPAFSFTNAEVLLAAIIRRITVVAKRFGKKYEHCFSIVSNSTCIQKSATVKDDEHLDSAFHGGDPQQKNTVNAEYIPTSCILRFAICRVQRACEIDPQRLTSLLFRYQCPHSALSYKLYHCHNHKGWYRCTCIIIRLLRQKSAET